MVSAFGKRALPRRQIKGGGDMIYFDDLLKDNNIDYTVSQIAKDFRKKYDFPEVRQLGVVVPDVEAAALQLEEKGVGPFLSLRTRSPSGTNETKTKPSKASSEWPSIKGMKLNCWNRASGLDFL